MRPNAPPPPKQQLLYALVARGATVLAEFSLVAGNHNLIAIRILEKIPSQDDMRVSYSQERFMFHVLVQDGITFLCMAEESFGRRIPFAFLEDTRGRFTSTYGDASKEAVAFEYNTDFARVLAERMKFFASDPAADTINRVKGEILEVKSIMIENIEKVLDRGEKLDLLVDKTEVLQEGALTFKRESRRMRRTFWWRNARLWVIVAVVVVLLIYLGLASACGLTLTKC